MDPSYGEIPRTGFGTKQAPGSAKLRDKPPRHRRRYAERTRRGLNLQHTVESHKKSLTANQKGDEETECPETDATARVVFEPQRDIYGARGSMPLRLHRGRVHDRGGLGLACTPPR